jgi:hypothetical protein
MRPNRTQLTNDIPLMEPVGARTESPPTLLKRTSICAVVGSARKKGWPSRWSANLHGAERE